MIRRLLLEDLHLKAAAVVLSLILFIFVRGDRVSEVGLIVPLIYQVPDSQVLVSEPVKRLRVTVAGRQSKLRALLRNGFDPIPIDLTHFTGTTYYFDEAMLRLEPGLRLLSIQPPKMEVRMEPRVHKEVPVAPNIVGTPDPNVRLVEVSVVPRKIQVEGARSVLRGLSEVKTVPVDVDNRAESTELEVGLSQPGEEVSYVLPDGKVKVQLVFEPRFEERVFTDVPIEVVNTSWRTVLAPRTARVRIEAPARLLPREGAPGFKLIADARELENKPIGSQHRLEVELENVPEAVRVAEIRPRKVLVRLVGKMVAGDGQAGGEGGGRSAGESDGR